MSSEKEGKQRKRTVFSLSSGDSHRVVLSLVDNVDLVGSTEEELKMRSEEGERRVSEVNERGLKNTTR